MTPKPKTAVQILDRALELIATPEQWTKGTSARNAQGEDVYLMNSDATCFCLSGSLYRSIKEAHLFHEIVDRVDARVFGAVCNQIPHREIPAYNDRATTTHADILAVLTKARAELVGKS